MTVFALLKESSGLLICIIIGIYSFGSLGRHWRLLFLQVIIYFLTIICSYLVTHYQETNGLALNNQWVYNIYMLIEGLLLFYIAFKQLRSRIHVLMLYFWILQFLVVFGCHFVFRGINTFFNYAYISEGIMVSILYSTWLYFTLHEKSDSRLLTPEVWMCLGLILYFACSVPYISLLNYLQNTSPDSNVKLFHYLIDVLANGRYLLLALAFGIVKYNHHKNPQQVV